MSKVAILDIETLSQPKEDILANLEPWNEEEARGRVPKNYKKDDAINGWLEDDKANHGKDILDKAALRPETGKLAVVGVWHEKKVQQLVLSPDGPETPVTLNGVTSFRTEKELVEHALMLIANHTVLNHNVIGWNLLGFDLPFIIKRAWLLGVPVGQDIFNPFSRYPIKDLFVDTMRMWQVGDRKAPYASLGNVQKLLKMEQKPDGSKFEGMWNLDRNLALAYNREELNSQAILYGRLGLL